GAEGAGEAAEGGEFAGVGLGGCGGGLGEDLGAVAVRQDLSVLEGPLVRQLDQGVADELVAGAHAGPLVSPTYRTYTRCSASSDRASASSPPAANAFANPLSVP